MIATEPKYLYHEDLEYSYGDGNYCKIDIYICDENNKIIRCMGNITPQKFTSYEGDFIIWEFYPYVQRLISNKGITPHVFFNIKYNDGVSVWNYFAPGYNKYVGGVTKTDTHIIPPEGLVYGSNDEWLLKNDPVEIEYTEEEQAQLDEIREKYKNLLESLKASDKPENYWQVDPDFVDPLYDEDEVFGQGDKISYGGKEYIVLSIGESLDGILKAELKLLETGEIKKAKNIENKCHLISKCKSKKKHKYPYYY